jgi:hypothetical protein
MTETRVIFRAAQDDLTNVAAVADLMRRDGVAFPTRSAAIRHALAVVASRAAMGRAATGA